MPEFLTFSRLIFILYCENFGQNSSFSSLLIEGQNFSQHRSDKICGDKLSYFDKEDLELCELRVSEQKTEIRKTRRLSKTAIPNCYALKTT